MWSKLDSLSKKQSVGRGMASAVQAGLVCLEAEKFAPNLFRAVSLKNGVLTLEVNLAHRLELTLVEQRLLSHLQEFATQRNLPVPTRFRLTNPPV